MEAKKLELIQEKAGIAHIPEPTSRLTNRYRSRLKKLLQKHNAARSKKSNGIETLIAFAKESAEKEDGAEVGATEPTTTTGDPHETLDRHLLDAEAHLLAFAVLHLDATSIPTFLAAGAVARQMRDGVDLPLQEDQGPFHLHDRAQELLHDEDTEQMTHHDQGDVNTPQADLEPPHAGATIEIEKEGVSGVVMIEIDP